MYNSDDDDSNYSSSGRSKVEFTFIALSLIQLSSLK